MVGTHRQELNTSDLLDTPFVRAIMSSSCMGTAAGAASGGDFPEKDVCWDNDIFLHGCGCGSSTTNSKKRF